MASSRVKPRGRRKKGAGNHGRSVECKLREASCSKTSPSTEVEKSVALLSTQYSLQYYYYSNNVTPLGSLFRRFKRLIELKF